MWLRMPCRMASWVKQRLAFDVRNPKSLPKCFPAWFFFFLRFPLFVFIPVLLPYWTLTWTRRGISRLVSLLILSTKKSLLLRSGFQLEPDPHFRTTNSSRNVLNAFKAFWFCSSGPLKESPAVLWYASVSQRIAFCWWWLSGYMRMCVLSTVGTCDLPQMNY